MIVVDAATGLVLLVLGLANRQRPAWGAACWPPGWPGSLATSRPGRSICTAGRLFTSFWPTRSCVLAPAWRGPPLPLVTCVAALPSLTASVPATLAVAVALVLSAVYGYAVASGPERRAPGCCAGRRGRARCCPVGWCGAAAGRGRPPAKPPNSSTICSSRRWRLGSAPICAGVAGPGPPSPAWSLTLVSRARCARGLPAPSATPLLRSVSGSRRAGGTWMRRGGACTSRGACRGDPGRAGRHVPGSGW